ncbi:unnamed protein product [Lactuca virosa]|uniref:Uncharacterized protein n=1 Tax=Lactuca virosa TaxID=75947 RepID=A0AAU9NAZ6_9ASTR|nr:unnamed protein product [Lactuca virosa]
MLLSFETLSVIAIPFPDCYVFCSFSPLEKLGLRMSDLEYASQEYSSYCSNKGWFLVRASTCVIRHS